MSTQEAKEQLSQKVLELEQLIDTISRSKVMWESTFDVISDPVFIISRNFEIKRANKALAKACGLNIREVISKKCYKLFAGYNEPCPKCPVRETLESQDSHTAELDMFPNGNQYTVNAYRMPDVPLDTNESIVLHYRNVTDEKQLQRKLRHSEKMAAIGTLAGGVAHEINNPLGGILAFVQIVMRELGESHSCLDDLKEIEDAARRCKKIVKDLLIFSRENSEDEMEQIQVEDILSKSISVIKMNATQANIRLELNMANDLPAIKGDINKLQQVLLNLVTNAIHAMQNKGGILTISTFANSKQDKIYLQIKDTGMGIASDKIDLIFDPYFTTKGQGEGTGLGLSICYKIMKEHKGKIDVESEVGKGTIMTLQFPAM